MIIRRKLDAILKKGLFLMINSCFLHKNLL